MNRQVTCDMKRDCQNPVTHIGEKGYVYCAQHAPDRRGVERVRRMAAWELKLVFAGKQLPSYKRGLKPVPNRIQGSILSHLTGITSRDAFQLTGKWNAIAILKSI